MDKFKYIFNSIGWAGFCVCLIILVFTNKCGQQTVINTKTEIHTFYDSAIKIVPAEKIKIPVPVTFTVPVPVSMHIDTDAILKNYFSINYYSQQIQDSSIRAFIKDSVSENKIIHRDFSYQWLKPVLTTQSTTVTLEPARRLKLLAGGFIESNGYNLSGAGPQASLQLKNGDLVSLSYDAKKHLVNKQPTFEVSMQFNLFKNAGTNSKNNK